MLSNENRELVIKWITEVYKELDNSIAINTDPILVKLQCALDILGTSTEMKAHTEVKTIAKPDGSTTYENETPNCVHLAQLTPLTEIPPKTKEISGLSSEISERLKAMLKADKIKFNKIMESFDE